MHKRHRLVRFSLLNKSYLKVRQSFANSAAYVRLRCIVYLCVPYNTLQMFQRYIGKWAQWVLKTKKN